MAFDTDQLDVDRAIRLLPTLAVHALLFPIFVGGVVLVRHIFGGQAAGAMSPFTPLSFLLGVAVWAVMLTRHRYAGHVAAGAAVFMLIGGPRLPSGQQECYETVDPETGAISMECENIGGDRSLGGMLAFFFALPAGAAFFRRDVYGRHVEPAEIPNALLEGLDWVTRDDPTAVPRLLVGLAALVIGVGIAILPGSVGPSKLLSVLILGVGLPALISSLYLREVPLEGGSETDAELPTQRVGSPESRTTARSRSEM